LAYAPLDAGRRCGKERIVAGLEFFFARTHFRDTSALRRDFTKEETDMANVVRYGPFEDAFDDLFRGFIMRPFGVERETSPAQIRLDVSENNGAYVVTAEMPGVKKDDINVTINGNQVAISAEVKKEKEAKNSEKELRSERYYGKVYRAFTLAQDVDEGAAQARYTDGVLELTLPKKAVTQAKKLAIQ
jgi:HSP20 family protein